VPPIDFWMCSLGLGGSPGDAPNSGLQNVVLLITQRCVGVCDSCTWLMTMAVPWTPSTTSKPMAATLLSSWKAAAACPAHGRRPRERQREPATGANTLRLPQTPPPIVRWLALVVAAFAYFPRPTQTT